MAMQSHPDRFLTLAEVCGRIGAARATIYSWQSKGIFPKCRKLGPRRVAWLESEVAAWMRERIAA